MPVILANNVCSFAAPGSKGKSTPFLGGVLKRRGSFSVPTLRHRPVLAWCVSNLRVGQRERKNAAAGGRKQSVMAEDSLNGWRRKADFFVYRMLQFLQTIECIQGSLQTFWSMHDCHNEIAVDQDGDYYLSKIRGATPSDGRDASSSAVATSVERSEADKIVDGMSFGQLCDEFQCLSSPAVEATARQLVRDILEMREGNRALGMFAIFVKYKDPLRSFTGREKFKRQSWVRGALDNPSVAVREMVMQSTSVLNIKWVLRGRPRFAVPVLGADLILTVSGTFILNQISGQVVEHVEEWDLSGSSPIAQAYFWISRLAYSTVENGKDAAEAVQGLSKLLQKEKNEDKENYYRDPLGDPMKFFQVDDNPQRDLYQIGLFIALLYLLVQFLRATL